MLLKARKKKVRRSFTLLEILVAMALLAVASSLIGWKMYEAVRKKRFYSQIERLQTRFTSIQRLAVTMQADWKIALRKNGKEWEVTAICEEKKVKRLAPAHLEAITIFFNGKAVDEMTLDFFTSGKVAPEGVFLFVQNPYRMQWKLSELFQREEGEKSGPIHPHDD